MPASLYSPLWYRVSAQQPHLASDVIVRQANSRGQAWCTLRSTSTGRQCRINGSAYQFVGRCDGLHSVQAIWDALLVDLRDGAPTQDEVIHVLGRLAAQGFLEYDTLPDIELQSERRAQRVARRRRGNLNPLAFRVPLGDPTTLLQRLDGLHRWLFHPLALVFWLVTMALAAAVAATHWSALSAHAAAYMSTPHYLLLSWLSFPFIKLVHELGHGLAVRHWGGEVHEAGISLFVLTPAPYVDASASAAFHRRYQRAGVAAIGIMVELVLAAVALMVWLNVQPGLVRDLAFVSMFVASASTLLFNANPLLKFDGYYVLCDALDVPNLGVRSQNYWLHVLQRCVFGDRQVTPLEFAPGEQKWLAVYARLSPGSVRADRALGRPPLVHARRHPRRLRCLHRAPDAGGQNAARCACRGAPRAPLPHRAGRCCCRRRIDRVRSSAAVPHRRTRRRLAARPGTGAARHRWLRHSL